MHPLPSITIALELFLTIFVKASGRLRENNPCQARSCSYKKNTDNIL
jgi:hypothetical protein